MMLKRRIAEPFFMEVTILMTWAIWSTRNGWIFENQDPSVSICIRKFLLEFKLLLLRAKKREKYFPIIEQWLHDIAELP
jgi:hypothetical protein